MDGGRYNPLLKGTCSSTFCDSFGFNWEAATAPPPAYKCTTRITTIYAAAQLTTAGTKSVSKMGFREGDRKGWKKYVPRTNKKKVENSESSNDAIKTSAGTVEDTEHSGRRWRLRSAVMKPFRRGRKSKSKQGNQEEGQNFDKNETVEKNSESQHLPRVDVRSVSPSTDTAAERPVASQQASLLFAFILMNFIPPCLLQL